MGARESLTILLGALAPLAAGCHLADHARVPAPELAFASEADSASSLGNPASPPTLTPVAARAAADRKHLLGSVAAPAEATSARDAKAVPATDDEPDLIPDDDPDEDLPAAPAPVSLGRDRLPPASRYASLDRASCEAELDRRRVPYQRVGEARGVIAPLRLTGPLSGVTFRSPLPEKQRRTATMEIYDCRLVLALDDFARMLAKHDIVEVVHLSVYRPVSKKVRLKGAGRRHGGALAIDAAIFKTKDGRTLSVEKDFHGRIGARPCPAPASASELRKIACEANDARIFNVLLTPDYNRAHRNHFHLEVTAGVRWTLVR